MLDFLYDMINTGLISESEVLALSSQPSPSFSRATKLALVLRDHPAETESVRQRKDRKFFVGSVGRKETDCKKSGIVCADGGGGRGVCSSRKTKDSLSWRLSFHNLVFLCERVRRERNGCSNLVVPLTFLWFQWSWSALACFIARPKIREDL